MIMSKGTRMIDGRGYDLVSRWTGLDAADKAAAHAERIREAGGMARCIKSSSYDVAVYALGGQKAW
jgi:hypothetical protein